MSYQRAPIPAPQTPDDPRRSLQSLHLYIDQELRKIELDTRNPSVIQQSFDVQGSVPPHYREGDLVYFGAGVVPDAPGLFIRDANSWRKL